MLIIRMLSLMISNQEMKTFLTEYGRSIEKYPDNAKKSGTVSQKDCIPFRSGNLFQRKLISPLTDACSH